MEMIDVMKRLNEISQREITEKHGGEHLSHDSLPTLIPCDPAY